MKTEESLALILITLVLNSNLGYSNENQCQQHVRLVGGQDDSYGIVEIYNEGVWMTVCEESWNDFNSEVVCRQLGLPFDNATTISVDSYYISGFDYNVMCLGNETCLEECNFGEQQQNTCQAARVRCDETAPNCSTGDIRLGGSGDPNEGRVEFCYDGFWGTICDDGWDFQDAIVACRQIGFKNFSAKALAGYGGGVGDIWSDRVDCTGNEDRLFSCNFQESSQPSCGHTRDAGVRCQNSTFVPFGPAVGDAAVSRNASNFVEVETPIVYYLQKSLWLYATTSGNIAFLQGLNIKPTNPAITLQQLIGHPSSTVYARVERNESTLEMIREMIAEENEELKYFHPSLAVVITWKYNVTLETIQAVITTDGQASFVTFIYNIEQVFRLFENDLIIFFTASDSSRRLLSSLPWHSLRIDGNCIALPDSCSINMYAVDCDEFSATTCRCHQNDYSGITPNSTLPATTASDGFEQCTRASNTSCVSGSVASSCISPGPQNTNYSGCYPWLLPCFLDGNCFNENCSDAAFIPFGEGSGDTVYSSEEVFDSTSGPIFVTVPVVYWREEYEKFHVSAKGVLSFQESHNQNTVCNLSCSGIPIIAPIWANLDFRRVGRMYYRTSQSPEVLDQVGAAVAGMNSALSGYTPEIAIVVTWFKAELTRSRFSNLPPLGTIQLIVSTDGNVSFATFLYTDPDVVLSILSGSESDGEEDNLAVIGFDGGFGSNAEANFGEAVLSRGVLDGINVFRIDGECITSALPGEVCGLQAYSAECDGFVATTCRCSAGYEYNGTMCVDVDECSGERACDENGDCMNTIGSFECTCRAGYIGNGQVCNDIDECEEEICGNFSECVNIIGDFRCICDPGFVLTEKNMCRVDTQTFIILGSSVSAVVLLGCGVLVCCLAKCCRRRRITTKRMRKLDFEMRQDFTRSSDTIILENDYLSRLTSMRVHSDYDLDISKSMLVNSCNLELGKAIGQGEFGIVYKAYLKTSFNAAFSETVAVKTLKGFLQDDLVIDLLKECTKMKEFNHPNILPLRGVCLDGGPAPYIIMPFMANGSLLGYLKENRDTLVLDPSDTEVDRAIAGQKKLLDMCIQVAKGMDYLASKRVVHRDLAARNCMIDSGFVIKVADFGLSESMDTTKEYFRQNQDEAIKLPIKWLAPESISDAIFSEKTDVWAYGVTCWEVFSGGKTPYPAIHPLELLNMLLCGHRLEKPQNAACSDEIYKIVGDCWAKDPKDRPHFYNLVADLSAFLSIMAEYFDLGASNSIQSAQTSSAKETDIQL